MAGRYRSPIPGQQQDHKKGVTRVKKFTVFITSFLVIAMLLVGAGTALAIKLETFELDRNAADTGTSGDDWDTLYGGLPSGPFGSAADYIFVADAFKIPNTDDIFN